MTRRLDAERAEDARQHRCIVTRIDAHPRALIDEWLSIARGCVGIASRNDLVRQGSSDAPDAGAYALRASECVERVHALDRYLDDERRMLLCHLEMAVERLLAEDRRRLSRWLAPVIDLRTRRVLSGGKRRPVVSGPS